MPNSGTVTAGSVALASQYNNLRADVLSNTTGHVHDGTTDGGKQIEGTVIKSTGATSGYVLTAGAGGTSTTWATPPGPTVTTTNASIVFPATGGTTSNNTYINNTVSNTPPLGVFGQGSVIGMIDTSSATSRTYRIFNLAPGTASGSVAASVSSAIAPAVAGTVSGSLWSSTWFSTNTASTAVVFQEKVAATTTGNTTLTIRKYNQALTSNIWNATLVSAGTGVTAVTTQSDEAMNQYVPEVNSHIGWYTQSSGSVILWSVNDSTGSFVTARIGTGTYSAGVSNEYVVQALVYVPGSAGADGTVWAMGTGYVGTTAVSFRQSFTLGTASLTAAATVTQIPQDIFYGLATENTRPTQSQAYYDKNIDAVVFEQQDWNYSIYRIFVGYDRTLSTVLFRSRLNYEFNNFSAPSVFYPKDGQINFGGSYVYAINGANDFYCGGVPIHATGASTDVRGLVGYGTPQYILFVNNGTATTTPLNARNYASVQIAGTAAKARMVTINNAIAGGFEVLGLRGTGIYQVGASYTGWENTTNLQISPSPFPFIIDANGSASLLLRNTKTPRGTVVFPVTTINIG